MTVRARTLANAAAYSPYRCEGGEYQRLSAVLGAFTLFQPSDTARSVAIAEVTHRRSIVGSKKNSPIQAADSRLDNPQMVIATMVKTLENVVWPRSPNSAIVYFASAPPNIIELPNAATKFARSTGVIPTSFD